MTATICRLILSLAALAGWVLVFIVAGVVMFEFIMPMAQIANFAIMGIAANGYLVVAWVLIWAAHVRFTSFRIGATFGVVIACAFISFVVIMVMAFGLRERELGMIIGSIAFPVLWLVGSTLVWRETRQERADRLASLGVHAVACPGCGYNLTGLRESKCPECGGVYTLDQLYGHLLEQRGDVG